MPRKPVAVLDITGGRLGVAIGTLGEERACRDFTTRAEYGTEVEAGAGCAEDGIT